MALAFVVIGVFFVTDPEKFVSPIMRNPEIIRIAGIASILFFGVASIYGFRKLFDRAMGLIIDENGITDNTSASSIGLIRWGDITEITTERVASNKFFLIYTSNPDEYLNKAKGFKRMLLLENAKTYGTPLSITSRTLKYSFNELEKLLIDRLNGQRERIT